jgi:hypothetical protein
MATERQIEANKLNSQKSTGPKSPEGKAKSSLNRLSHGLASSATLVPGEDPDEFKALLTDLTGEHQPAFATEQILVEQMALNQWLSLRAFRLQGEAFLDQTLGGTKFGIPKDLGVLIRYQTSAERAFHKAHNEFVKTKKQRSDSEIGFESQNAVQPAVQEVQPAPQPLDFAPEAPEKHLKPASVTPIAANSSIERPRPTFTAAELNFELCPEAIEYFKKVG